MGAGRKGGARRAPVVAAAVLAGLGLSTVLAGAAAGSSVPAPVGTDPAGPTLPGAARPVSPQTLTGSRGSGDTCRVARGDDTQSMLDGSRCFVVQFANSIGIRNIGANPVWVTRWFATAAGWVPNDPVYLAPGQRAEIPNAWGLANLYYGYGVGGDTVIKWE
jgi:hypothetical protein